jgi:GR25 family glycosyltransferase involved in LPS biosynthesis
MKTSYVVYVFYLLCVLFVVCLVFAAYLLYILYKREHEGFAPDVNSNSTLSLAAYVINLDRNRERLARIAAEYSSSDVARRRVPLRRVAAVDAAHLDIERYVTGKAWAQLRETQETGERLRHHDLTPGAVGCFLSHVTVMRMLLADEVHDAYFILEDDAVIPTRLADDLFKAIAATPEGWDVLLLGHHQYAVFDEARSTPSHKRVLAFWGTHALIINKAGARKIVAEYEADGISKQIDSMMSLMIKRGKLVVYATEPVLLTVGQFGTDIQVPVRNVAGVNPFDLEAFRS